MNEREQSRGGSVRAPRDALQTHWPEMRGRVQERWSRLTDEWLGEVNGQRDRLADKLRDAYGVSEAEANRQVDDFVETHWGAMSARNVTPTGTAQSDNAGAEHEPGPGNTRIDTRRDTESGVGTGTIGPGGRKI